MNLLRKPTRSKFNLSVIWLYVKRRFDESILRMMHYFGFYVQKMPTAESFYNKLKNYPVLLQEDELRKITIFLRKANDGRLYGKILNKFVPQMNNGSSHTKFTGTGSGATTLNVYRKVTFGEEVLFEKVYFNSSLDFVRIKWFYDNIYSSMSSNIKAPALYKSISGELITIVYFKFVELVSLDSKDIEATIFNFSRELYKLSLIFDVRDKIESAPAFLKEYTAHFEYKRKIEIAEAKASELLGDNFNLRSVEKVINQSVIILTHGDMHKGNVFDNNYLIDWDPFGLYPPGLEVAYILLFLKRGVLDYMDLNLILEREYRNTILKEEWDDFELNCLYFYYVFTVQSLEESGSSRAQLAILNRIVELYNKKMNRESVVLNHM